MAAFVAMCMFFAFDAMAQDDPFFIKKINRERFRGLAIIENQNRIFISATGICEDKECSIVMEVDTLGHIVWEKQLSWLDGTVNNIIADSDTLIISGNNNINYNEWLIHKMDMNSGDSISTMTINDSLFNFINRYNFGILKWNLKYAIYGVGVTKNTRSSLIYIVNPQSGIVDTVLNFNPTSSGFLSSLRYCEVDHNNNLVAFTAYDRSGGERSDIITKIDSNYNTLWQYQTIEDDTDTFPYGGILSDGRVVFNTSNLTFDRNKGSTLCLSPEGDEIWQTFLPEVPIALGRLPNNFFIDAQDNILQAGSYSNGIDNDYFINSSPWLFNRKENSDSLWSRVYYQEDPNWDIASITGSFLDLVRLQDGSIMAVGRMNNAFTEGRSILLARLDSVGCLTPNCPEVNNITEILTSNQDIHISNADLGIQLFPNPVHDVLHLRSTQEITHVQIIDIHGAVVLSEQQAKQIQLAQLPSGIYFARCSTEKGETTLKFVKE